MTYAREGMMDYSELYIWYSLWYKENKNALSFYRWSNFNFNSFELKRKQIIVNAINKKPIKLLLQASSLFQFNTDQYKAVLWLY